MPSTDVEIAENNTKRYEPLKVFCEKVRNMPYYKWKEKEVLLSAEFEDIIGNQIKNFDINDILIDFKTPNRYSTPLQYILFTDIDVFISKTYKRFLDVIEINIEEKHPTLCFKNLLSLLYENLMSDYGRTDVLLPLIYKSENIDFFKTEQSISRKLQITNFLIIQKDNYVCSDAFLKKLKNVHEELLADREKFIISELKLSLNQSLSKIDSNDCPSSEKMKKARKQIEALLEELKG
ncbi:MAG: hypothetical protein AB7E13_09430 [Arcobacteraceae bacterium]